MTNQVFQPEHKSINEVFVRDVKYIIPPYQRPYSWESIGKNDTNDQINKMWEDFVEFYGENDENEEYFFGSIVVFKDGDGFQVVDGQQSSFSKSVCSLRPSSSSTEGVWTF